MYKKISYSEFIEEVKNNILDFMPEEFADAKVNVQKINKTNRTVYGLIIKKKENGKEQMVYPTLYLEGFYEKEGDIDDVMMQIANTYVNALNNVPAKFKKPELVNKTLNSSNIIFTLINTEKNLELLKEVPHRAFYDLSIVYRSVVNIDEDNGIASAIIRNEHMNKLGLLTEEELFETAYENTKRLLPIEVKGMQEIMMEMIGMPPVGEEKMYVISNKNKINGAINFLYIEDTLEKIAEKTNSNLYILPSSVHEVIAVVDEDGMEKGNLINMVREVNEQEVSEEEQLSDNIYCYDKENKKISLVTIF